MDDSASTIRMSASEFKAKCLEVFDRLAARELKRVTITKRGRVVGVLQPPEPAGFRPEDVFGCMRGSVVIPTGCDLTEPASDEAFEAESGLVHQ